MLRSAPGRVAAVVVTVAVVLAVVGLVVTNARLGGLGYAVFLVPVVVVAGAVGALGAALVHRGSVVASTVRTILGAFLGLVAVAVLLAVAWAGFATPPRRVW